MGSTVQSAPSLWTTQTWLYFLVHVTIRYVFGVSNAFENGRITDARNVDGSMTKPGIDAYALTNYPANPSE